MKQQYIFLIIALLVIPSRILGQSNDSLNAIKLYEKARSFNFRMDNVVTKDEKADSTFFYFNEAYPLLKKAQLWDQLIIASINITRYKYGKEGPGALRSLELLADSMQKFKAASKITNIYLALGAIVRNDDFVKSADYYTKAIRLSAVSGNEVQRAILLKVLGDLYFNSDSISKALSYYHEALRLKKKNNKLLNMVYSQISLCYRASGKFDTALAYLDSAIIQCRDNILQKAQYISDKGAVYSQIGDYNKALEYCEAAIKLRLAAKRENIQSIIKNYYNVAVVKHVQGDYIRSNEYLDESTALILKTYGIDKSLYRNYKLYIENYVQLMDYQKALKYCNLMYSMLKESDMEVSEVYDTFGKIYLHMDKPDSSLAYFKLAGSSEDNHIHLGNLYFKLRDYVKSRMYYQLFLNRISRKRPEDHPAIGSTYMQIGNSYFMEEKYDSAMFYYMKLLNSCGLNPESPKEQVIRRASVKDMDISIFEAFWRMSQMHKFAYERTNNINKLSESHSAFMVAAEILNNYKQYLESDNSKLFWSQQTSGFIDEAVENAILCAQIFKSKEYYEDLFRLIEMSKMHVLKGSINEFSARSIPDISDSLLDLEKGYRKKLNSMNVSMRKELENKDPDENRINYWERTIFEIKRDYSFLIDSLEKAYPEYFRLKYRTATVGIHTVQSALTSDQSLLQYYVDADKLHLMIIDRDSVYLSTFTTDSSFRSNLERIAVLLKKGNLIRNTQRNEFIELSSHLYEVLIGRVKSNFSDKKELIIIPGNTLLSLPFEILITARSESSVFSSQKFLISDYQISYQYSATLAFDPIYRKHLPENDCFTGFAPTFSAEEKGTGSRNLQSLIYNEDEVKKISELFRQKKIETRTYLGSDASKANFKKLSSSKYVHIATHSIANEETPELSALYFSNDAQQDNALYADEVFNLSLNAELVVLSSCETGAGKIISGEGILALTRGFIFHGIPNLVFSLWEVSDKSTGTLMVEFYRNILSGKTYKAALRESKLKMLNNEFTSYPDKWGAFILIGN